MGTFSDLDYNNYQVKCRGTQDAGEDMASEQL